MQINFLRKLPEFKGKRRLARFLLGRSLERERDLSVNGKFGLRYKLPNLIENIGFEILVNGIYEKETIDFILGKLPDEAVFLDIGANIGGIVLPICRLKPGVMAYGVEASGKVFDYLKENREINKVCNLVLENRAISDKDEEQMNFYSPETVYGKGSFSPVYTRVAEIVKTIRLDSLIANCGITKVDFIKVDVEGYEYFVFKGGSSILVQKGAPDILFEFLDWAEGEIAGREPGDAQRLLIEYGYELYELVSQGLKKINGLILNRSAMIFATKKMQ